MDFTSESKLDSGAASKERAGESQTLPENQLAEGDNRGAGGSQTPDEPKPMATEVSGAGETQTPSSPVVVENVVVARGAGASQTPVVAPNGANATAAADVEELNLDALSIKRIQLSGAAKRRRARQMAREQGIVPLPRSAFRPNAPKPPAAPTSQGKAMPTPARGSSSGAGTSGLNARAGGGQGVGQAKALPPPTVTPATKRPRGSGSTPSSTESKPERVKKSRGDNGNAVTPPAEGAGNSYSAAVTTRRMAVVLGDYPDTLLTKEQGTKLITAINREAMTADPDPDRTFDGVSQKDGAVLVSCCSSKASEWLVETVGRLQLEGLGPLRTGSAKEVLNRPRVSVLLPTDYLEEADARTLLGMLGHLNPGLGVDTWRVFAEKREAKRVLLCIEIQQADLMVLRATGLRASFGLRTVTFRVLNEGAVAKTTDAQGGSDQPAA